MIILEYILCGILLLTALFIVFAVTVQKSGDEGLSGTIAGGSETYYGKDKSVGREKKLLKWTLIAAVIFAIAVLVVYVVQPDYVESQNNLDHWKELSNFASIFDHSH
jgi:preprotein translocase subunit SecG